MEPISVRPARPSDLDTLVRFVAGVARESEGRELDAETVRRGLQDALGDPTSVATYYLAERQGSRVGGLMVTKEWSDWTAAWYWWIQSVYVVPEARGTGVFDALYREVSARARREGVKSIRLYVDGHNRAGIRAYERLGMTRSTYLVYTHDL